MIYQLRRIARDVRIAMDQNSTSDALVAEEDVDTLALDDIIYQKTPEAVRRVHISAPVYLLESGHHFGDSIHWGAHESGWVLLPDDFMRLVVFQMSDWERAVYSAISPGDAAYGMVHSRYKGIRGTAQKPICAVAVRPEGKVLEFYSCKSEEAQVVQAMYMPYPQIDANGGIDISERCYTAVVYMTAALVSTTYGDEQKSASFIELSKSALE